MTRSTAVVQKFLAVVQKPFVHPWKVLLHICVVEERWKLLCRKIYETKCDVHYIASHPLSYFQRNSDLHHRPDSAIYSYKAHQSSNQVSYSSF